MDHIELKQGDMKIGRRPGSDIFLDNLAVSGEHANIFTIGEDSFIQDLSSTNGSGPARTRRAAAVRASTPAERSSTSFTRGLVDCCN